jgi:hypothetical protein
MPHMSLGVAAAAALSLLMLTGSMDASQAADRSRAYLARHHAGTRIVMSKPVKVQIVEKARALIEDERHWCRGELARDLNALSVCPTDSRAVRRCALGALIASAYQITNDFSRAHDLAIGAVRPLYGSATGCARTAR